MEVWQFREYLDQTEELEKMYPKAEPLPKVERYTPSLFNDWLIEAKDSENRKSSQGKMKQTVDMDQINRDSFVSFYLHKIDFEANELVKKWQNTMSS